MTPDRLTNDRLTIELAVEPYWQDSFVQLFELCRASADEGVVILAESQTRQINLHLAQAALAAMAVPATTVTVPGKPAAAGPVIRSTGASNALTGEDKVEAQLQAADLVIDLTVEGLMHAPQTGSILKAGTRIMTISNEHPDILSRLRPDPAIKDMVKGAVAACRAADIMTVTSPAGTDLTVAMADSATVGVWGWTDRPGTLAHWPGGLVVSFLRAASCNGVLVFAPGDINLTFKRYFETEVRCTITDDFITAIEGNGTDAQLMRRYLQGFGDPLAYATSHVGWGLNPAARYESLTMYDKMEMNGTELRALAGNFLYSTGANEFADRFTDGHFDLPMMGCDIALDGVSVVRAGVPV